MVGAHISVNLSVHRVIAPFYVQPTTFLTRDTARQRLSVALARMAGVTPSITICEMLDDESGYALPKSGAKAYAKKHGLVFVEGSEVLDRWEADKHRES